MKVVVGAVLIGAALWFGASQLVGGFYSATTVRLGPDHPVRGELPDGCPRPRRRYSASTSREWSCVLERVAVAFDVLAHRYGPRPSSAALRKQAEEVAPPVPECTNGRHSIAC
jgi:hypothetical protein